ncbi:MAG: LLM class flavin-dependent oxidoreductase [Hyphomicrobiaceae bacterium]
MQVWFHNEITYPFVAQEVLDGADSVRASLPNRYCDPKVAADLFEECLDEFLLCDDLGLNVVAIEHHAGINSLLSANPLLLGILARQTRKARILSLGTLVSLRDEPVRIAEEYATADIISRGRLDIGFVKSGGSEMASNNANPITNIARFWEAIDLIKKSLTEHDGPFSWQGKHFTHRHVNIWPQAWQKPHPPFWAATGDPHTAAEVGRRGMVNALILRGAEDTRKAWHAYREARRIDGLPAVDLDHYAYAAMVAVADTHEAGVALGEKLLWFLNTGLRSAPQFARDLPGTIPAEFAPKALRSDREVVAAPEKGQASSDAFTAAPKNNRALIGISPEMAMKRGILFAGSPDTVFDQISSFYEQVGGFGHLVTMGRAGFMTHAETSRSIELLAQEVAPRLTSFHKEQMACN